MMGLARVAIEPGLDIASRGPAEAQEWRECSGEAECKKNDPGDAQRKRGNEP